MKKHQPPPKKKAKPQPRRAPARKAKPQESDMNAAANRDDLEREDLEREDDLEQDDEKIIHAEEAEPEEGKLVDQSMSTHAGPMAHIDPDEQDRVQHELNVHVARETKVPFKSPKVPPGMSPNQLLNWATSAGTLSGSLRADAIQTDQPEETEEPEEPEEPEETEESEPKDDDDKE